MFTRAFSGFAVADLNAAREFYADTLDELLDRGVDFELYDGFGQDERGVMRHQGPPIAWFRDPSGNILAVIESSGSGPE
jgi:hypothetical protein